MLRDTPNPYSAEFEQLDLIASPVFVLEIDEEGAPRYVAFNAFARQISQLELSHYLGRTAKEIYPQAYGRTAFSRHCEVANSGKTTSYELDLPMAGIPRTLRTTLVPYTDPETGRQLLYGSSVDISMEQAVREKQVSFDTLTQEMEQFVALAAHDLRAPMRNMAMLADMLKEDFVDHGDGKYELLEMMEDVAKKSMALITDVLNHARTTDIGQERSNFSLSALCQDICDVLDPHGQHNFDITSAQVSTDRTAMQIALRNIIDNALKYGGKPSLKIDIRVRPMLPDMLDVTIQDDGHGFSEAAIKFLNGGAFETDSGYGLLGVRRMVEARGGTVAAKNAQKGRGAVVRFNLPGEWIGTSTSMGGTIQDWTIENPADQIINTRRAS